MKTNEVLKAHTCLCKTLWNSFLTRICILLLNASSCVSVLSQSLWKIQCLTVQTTKWSNLVSLGFDFQFEGV